MKEELERLCTLSELADSLGIPAGDVRALHRAGVLLPDYTSKAGPLFVYNRLPELRRAARQAQKAKSK